MGPHIGMQFHIEMDEATITDWCLSGETEIRAALTKPHIHTAVNTTEHIHQLTPHALPLMRQHTHYLYRRWIENLRY